MKIFVKSAYPNNFSPCLFSMNLSNVSFFFYLCKCTAKRDILCTIPDVGLDGVPGIVPPIDITNGNIKCRLYQQFDYTADLSIQHAQYRQNSDT